MYSAFKNIILCAMTAAVLVSTTAISIETAGATQTDKTPKEDKAPEINDKTQTPEGEETTPPSEQPKKKYIKWVDFKVPCEAMKKAILLDIDTHDKEIKLNYIELLAYLAMKNGNDFSDYREKQLDDIAQKLLGGATMAELTADNKYYKYFLEAYTAILSGFVGDFEVEVPDDSEEGRHWEKRYGIKVFSPIAKSFPYSHYDDFNQSRSYGYARVHLGNDLIGQVGTPIVAVEGGVIEAMGWNQYGGWRIGIRSFDRKRYYYYGHMRKDFPYRKDLKTGSIVQSGEVIGYLGRTGYSTKENTNNINTSHLHFGMELVFDECQKESNNEIWINVYEIVRLLDNKRSEVIKDPETKDYHRVYGYRDLSQPAPIQEVPLQPAPDEGLNSAS